MTNPDIARMDARQLTIRQLTAQEGHNDASRRR
jgi:hypothetical protein